MIITKTPFRISLGGGGTDLPSFYTGHGGYVITMAINKYVYITLKPDDFEGSIKLRYSEIETVKTADELRNTRAREVLKLHNVCNVEINTCADLSSRSGLGSSGSFLVGLIRAIREHKREVIDPTVIAEEACDIEINRLREPVGKQDQYIASYGGVQVLDIGTDGNVKVTALDFDTTTLINKMHVYALNVYRDASDVLADQNKATPQTIESLKVIKEYAYRTRELLVANDFDKYGLLLDEHWSVKKSLSKKISIPKVDELYDLVKKDFCVLGGKIIGAGGGGFLLLYADKKHNELESFMRGLGMKRLTYMLDVSGNRTIGNFT